MSSINDNAEITRNSDGTFAKGVCGNPGGRLSKGQRIVREFALERLSEILDRLQLIAFNQLPDFLVPIEVQERVLFKLVERAAGKVQEAPIESDDDGNAIDRMSGQRLMQLMAFAFEQSQKNGESTSGQG